MGNTHDNFSDFIENIMYNKNNHHLVFDENNILKRINCLYGINDEIATIVIGKQYEFKSPLSSLKAEQVPYPYYNYINNNEIYHILLDEKQYAFLNKISETINHIYSFNDIGKDNFNEILKNIKNSYFNDIEEDNQYCWKIFENYANDYFKIINISQPEFCNKYDEEYHYEEIYDKIFDLQIKYKNDIMKEIVPCSANLKTF
jgi:hypothetical protein